MIIGISINGVLRDFLKQIEIFHSKCYPDIDTPIEVNDYDLDKWITFPEEEVKQAELTFNPEFNLDLTKDGLNNIENIELETKIEEVTIDEFLYEKGAFEIFGSSNEVLPNIVVTLNRLILDNPQHDFILMSKESGLSIPSTHFFLSKTFCMCPNIKFLNSYKDHWDFVDVMVTDHPEIITTKPNNKKCVVVRKNFNTDLSGDYLINSLKDFGDLLEEITI